MGSYIERKRDEKLVRKVQYAIQRRIERLGLDVDADFIADVYDLAYREGLLAALNFLRGEHRTAVR